MNKPFQISVLILFQITVSVCFAQFAGGNGTAEAPWQIASAQHLNSVRDYLGEVHRDKYFLQTANIDLGVAPWNTGEGWTAIGDNMNKFYGNYDGGYNTIENLTIDRFAQYQGLFGFTDGGYIKKLRLSDVAITSPSNFVGGIAARSLNTIFEDCSVSGTIQAGRYSGGLVGRMDGGEVDGCFTSGSVTATSATSDAGGLIGYIAGTVAIENCYSTMNVTGNRLNIGGFVGYAVSGTVTKSFATG